MKPEEKQTSPQSPPFTVFSRHQRIHLTYLLGYLALASSLTATIYLPLIETMSDQYHVSIQAINITITLYVVFQALSPAFFAPMSDTLGRRPVFLFTFSIYSAASIGLAFNKHSYVALLLLRSLQSIGGSAVMSLAYAVVADISVPAERGKILGPMLAAANFGPCFGPVIGGGIVRATGQTQWAFWTLVIFGASSILLIGFTLPETGRAVVGNGAVQPRGMWRTWWNLFRQPKSRYSKKQFSADAAENVNSGKTGAGVFSLPNPMSSVRLIFYADTFLTLWSAASPYAVWYCIQASIPIIYSQAYGYSDLIVSLCFLSGGAGVILGGLLAGRLMDFNYKKIATETGFSVDHVAGDDLRNFPIEVARSRGSYTLHVLSMCALAGYGWTVERRVHPSVPLVLQFVIGVKSTMILQVFSALLVDIFPSKSGTAGASNNLTRCSLAAAAVAILQPLKKSIGNGWMFTLVGLVDGLTGMLAVLLLRRKGRDWRQKRELVVEAS